MSQSVAQSLVARPGAYDGTLMARERGREEERVVIDDSRLCDRFLIDDDEELAGMRRLRFVPLSDTFGENLGQELIRVSSGSSGTSAAIIRLSWRQWRDQDDEIVITTSASYVRIRSSLVVT